jgi:hypothetical protein
MGSGAAVAGLVQSGQGVVELLDRLLARGNGVVQGLPSGLHAAVQVGQVRGQWVVHVAPCPAW